ncbi:MAG: hypothetical protein JWQ32_2034 [Marmoricola sp.]|nr:hypothetical protein [Marmoricola sp.]
MDAAAPPELQRAGAFGAFPGPTESLYRQWALKRAWPANRVVLWISILVWASQPVVQPHLLELHGSASPREWLLCCGVSVPILLITALFGGRHLHIWVAPAVLTVTTIEALVAIDWLEAPNTPTLMVSTTLLFLYLAPVLQFPFRSTAFVLLVTVPISVWWATVIADDDGTLNGTLNFELWLLGAGSLFALAMSLVIENNSRRRFVDEQVIARQQEELIRTRALIRRYAPPAVADRIEHGDSTVGTAQRLRVTIFFADVVGFTTLADRLDPEALAEIMNDYLGSVAEIIERHLGTLNEFAGDGVMAIFGAPDELQPRDQVLAAVRAARELQASLPEWSQRWYSLGIDQDLQARIGINTGVVSVGTFGSTVRATYTGIGLQTNIAARIQAQCNPGSVLLSNTSWHLVSDTVTCHPRGEVDVKGVHFPIAMYEPVAGPVAKS